MSWAVSQPVAGRVAGLGGRIATVPLGPERALCHAYRSSVCSIAALLLAASLLRAASRYNPVAKLPPVMIQFIVSRHSPPARSRARALLAVSWPPLAVSWAWLVVSWPTMHAPERPCTPVAHPGLSPRPCLALLCHDTIRYIVT